MLFGSGGAAFFAGGGGSKLTTRPGGVGNGVIGGRRLGIGLPGSGMLVEGGTGGCNATGLPAGREPEGLDSGGGRARSRPGGRQI